MTSQFTSGFFSGNRQRLRQVSGGTAPIVLTANGLLQRGSDTTFPFQQDGSFWYLSGVNEPDVVLVMDKDKEYLIVPRREAIREAFDGAIALDDLKRLSGVDEVLVGEEGWKRLSARLKRVKHVATLAPNPAYLDTFGIYTNPARQALTNRLKEYNADLELVDLRMEVARLRMIKQPLELAALQSAIDITIDTLQDIFEPAVLKSYGYEYELEADLSRGFRRHGARGHAFEPIVASGSRAAVLHNVANDGAFAPHELLVVDVGAEYDHYAADITRTIAIGTPTPRQRAVHQVVQAVQEQATTLLKPGVSLKEYEKQVETLVGGALLELGLLQEPLPALIRQYYPHACSHFLGLDAHDAGDYEQPLQPGTVLTVEPGIYIPEEGIGVRIEDDVLITEQGHTVLSERLPRSVA